MTTITPPPRYREAVDDFHLLLHEIDTSLPPYSRVPRDAERVLPDDHTLPSPLTRPLSNTDPSQLWSPKYSFVYESNQVQVTLGPRFWGLELPAFGTHGLVEGTVKLGKKCTHTHRVTATVRLPYLYHP